MSNDSKTLSEQKLEDKLDSIILPDEEKEKIAKKGLGKGVLSAFLDSIGLGAVVKVYETAEKVKEEINERKKAILLSHYFEGIDNIEEEIKKFERFVSDPIGNTLFSKIIRIVNINPPNKAYVELFAKILKKITTSDFKRLFSKNDYALNQIEKLTPQAMLILVDYERWPEFKIGNYASHGGVITSEWIEEFSVFYTEYIKISHEEMKRRIAHSLRELLRNNLIMSYIQGEKDSKTLSSMKESSNNAVCDLTELGREIIEYI